MRITLIGPLPPPHGGIASHIERMMEYLRALGHHVRALSPFSSSRPGHEKTHIMHLPFVLAQDGCPQIRHWHLTGWHRLLVMACCERLLPGKSVYTLHVDLERVGPPDTLLRWMLHPVDTVVCVKEEDARRIRERRLHENVVVIPAFIPSRQPPQPEDELCEWLHSRSPALLVMATHWGVTGGQPTYGLDLLLSNMEQLVEHFPRLGLLALVPAGPIPDDQRQLVAEQLRNHPVHVRFVDRPVDLLAVLPAADIFVRPTRTDGDALSIREAAALGVRVVASDCVARPVPCRLFRSGSQEELQSALLTALQDPVLEVPVAWEHADALLNEYRQLAGEI
jgi:glycogen(starch) synthase